MLHLADDRTIHFVYGIVYVLIALLTVVLHGRNLIWILKHGSYWLAPASKLVHLNLTLSSFAIMLGVPFAAYSCFKGEWAFSLEFCQCRAAEAMVSGLVLLMTVYLCCVDRYLMIRYEHWYIKSGLKLMIPVIIFVWISAGILGFLPFYGIGKFGFEPQGTSCLVDLTVRDRNTVIYILGLAVFTFILPILIGFVSILSAHFGLSKQNKAAPKLKQMNKLVASVFLLSTIGWAPFVYIYVTYSTKPNRRFPLYVEYLGPICCKAVTSILPLLYWAFLKGNKSPIVKPKIVYTKSGRAKKIA